MICSTIIAVKSLYKYVYKGHDRAIVEFRIGDSAGSSTNKAAMDIDEIVFYFEAHYVSATESCYRLFAYELHSNLPHVMRLVLHLEHQQPVVFTGDLTCRWFFVDRGIPPLHDVFWLTKNTLVLASSHTPTSLMSLYVINPNVSGTKD